MTSASTTVFIVTPGGLGDRAGIGRLVTTISRHWLATGTGHAFRVIDPYGPAIRALVPLYFLRAVLQIVWNVWRGRVGLLHVHMAAKGSVLRKGLIVRLGARLRVPVLLQLHGTEVFYQRLPRWAQRWVRRTFERADRIIVLGEHFQKVVTDEIGIDAARVLVLPSAVCGPQELPARAGAEGLRLVFLGRLEPEKGVPELLDALADPRLAQWSWSARLAGRGDAAAVRARAAALGLADRVDISGWIPEPVARRCLADADIFVLPSHAEGLSMAMLEAMAFGLAIITTPVGATAEAVIDGVSGMLVPIGDATALAAALARVISDPELRAALQAGARRMFCNRFDIAAYGRRLEQVYADLMAE